MGQVSPISCQNAMQQDSNFSTDDDPFSTPAFWPQSSLLRTYLWPTYLQWTSVSVSEVQWTSVNFSGLQWTSVKVFLAESPYIWTPCISGWDRGMTEVQGSSVYLSEVQWNSAYFSEVQWSSAYFTELQWCLHIEVIRIILLHSM